MQLRAAAVSNLTSIEALLRASDLPVAGVADHLPNFIVAVDADGMTACGGIEYHGNFALIRSIAVAEGARGNGLGKAVVSRLLDACRGRAVEAIVLRTTTAETYFARLGFVRIALGDVPGPLLSSGQFAGVCPASATVMLLRTTIQSGRTVAASR
ncbi:GNAT family N-acetyltransferase [Burkholderia cepacia]|uniref:arsenic resistance N-acetyltransferase ArsN2 n=1 Tax=Burkholderia cepacia TaxID=292 RepID=UPI00249F85A9|nr:arsenic resistance N-acetyltransferase ArsN2 [Burkholderia cepacia]WGY70482.1 GNAT family N-acetyltransferase [Burkholderia cepacia]